MRSFISSVLKYKTKSSLNKKKKITRCVRTSKYKKKDFQIEIISFLLRSTYHWTIELKCSNSDFCHQLSTLISFYLPFFAQTRTSCAHFDTYWHSQNCITIAKERRKISNFNSIIYDIPLLYLRNWSIFKINCACYQYFAYLFAIYFFF